MANSTTFSAARNRPDQPRTVVIGAGIGGLVAALLLAGRGLPVTVIERAATPGGKLREVEVDGVRIDAGPTVFTMRGLFEEIFEEAGATLSAELPLTRAGVLARHAWRAGEHLDLYADVDRSAEAIGQFSGPAEARRYRAFCAKARRVYRMLEQPFIRAPSPSIARLVATLGPGDLFGISPFTTLWRALGRCFEDPRLRQLFGRYATYCGSSPFLCPATLMLVAHVEQDGVWLVEGGMHRLARVLAALAHDRGASFRYETEVRSIEVERGRASAVTLGTGERIPAEAVICNADVAALASGQLGPDVRAAARAPKPAGRSLSAVTVAMCERTRGLPLQRHNVFFSDDYAAEFDDIFGHRRLPVSPTVYVCAQDRDALGHLAPSAWGERLFCIVNAPPDGDTHGLGASEIAQCEDSIFRTLERGGLSMPDRHGASQVTTPSDFERLFPATGGALYGAASHGWMASFRRPGQRSRIPGLYLCGGSTHPGPGIPMAALSGRMAALSLVADWGSTHRFHAMAMAGGMSTA